VGRKGKKEEEFNIPHAICLDVRAGSTSATVRTAHPGLRREGKFSLSEGERAPYGMSLMPAAEFVADGLADCDQVLDAEGKPLGPRREGTGAGQFRVPHAVCVDSKGAVYIAEFTGQRLQNSSRGEEAIPHELLAASCCCRKASTAGLFRAEGRGVGRLFRRSAFSSEPARYAVITARMT